MEAGMATKVTDDGQVTIPKAILEQLGIGPGSEVTFRRAPDGSVVMERAEKAQPPRPLSELVGIAGPGPSTDELMALLRGD
jgi:antitoxin PrlF